MSESGQVSTSAAEVYEQFFLPALFGAWAPRLVEAARLGPGMRVLDAACGTGVVALEAARAVTPGGEVVGLDLNPGMVAVARRKAPALDWREGSVDALPFASGAFDAVLCQFALMFFPDRERAIAEMWRVLGPGGRLAVAVWDGLDEENGYSGVRALLAGLFGDDVAAEMDAPYALGDAHALSDLFAAAGLPDARVERADGEACFPSISSWIRTEIRGWTLSERIDDEGLERLIAEAERTLGAFTLSDGSVRFSHPALIVRAEKPGS